jgi:hypothetical protein
MPLYADNILQQVQTYQRSSLGYLQNLCCFVSTANTKFKDFEKIQANLGSSVTFDTPPRATTSAGLVVRWQPAVQLVETLTCDQAFNSSFTVTAQQRIFNLEKGEDEYIEVFGKSFLTELATEVEGNLALNCNSSVPVMTVNAEGQSVPTGALHTESGPFRYFGDGVTQLTSYQQLAQMIMLFKNFGAVSHGIKVYLPDTVYPAIVGTGLNQFAPERNNEIAMSWEVGEFGTPRVKYYQSNLLPIQYAGTIGETGLVMTLVSTNDPSGQNVTQLTFSVSGDNSDPLAIMSGDMFSFNDGVSGFSNMRYLTYIGHKVSANKVQMRAIAQAGTNASGLVTINLSYPLNWAGGQAVNLNQALQPGMQATVLPSHKCGLVVGGDAFYIAMPQLPDQRPFDTANEYDLETGVSLRMTYGSILGANQKGIIYDETHGSLVVQQYSMRVIVPLTQA